MMLDKKIEGIDVECTMNVVDEAFIGIAESELGVGFGIQLRNYILKYGYLAFEDIELYGINSKQKLQSDMISQTLYLHKYFELTKNYIALENTGEGIYILVGSNDKVYKYDSEQDVIQNLHMLLEEYIIFRLGL